MANGNPELLSGVPVSPEYSTLFGRLLAAKQSLSKETLDALEYRSKKGYKPVSIEDKYIDVKNEDEFNQYKKALSSLPLDPKVRNKFISELGYRPVIRYKKQDYSTELGTEKKLVPRKKYDLSFTTMPDKHIQLNSEEEYNQARSISDIDNALADVYKKKYSNTGLDRSNAYKSYVSANPEQYSKMYLSEAERNAAISDYAKNKGVDANQLIKMYSENRDKYYPRDIVSGSGALEQQGNKASSTLYGYRNYLTTMIPNASEYQEEVVEPVAKSTVKESEVTYPFKFGYKSDSGSRPQPYKPSSPGVFNNDCPGGVCEKLGERMASRNKYLFKKRNGGSIVRSGFIKLYNK